MRKLFWAVFRSHSQGAQGGILDQLFGKVSYLIGLVALFAVVGYVIYDQLSTSLEVELQSVVSASVLKYQTSGKFPSSLESIVARGLADSQTSPVSGSPNVLRILVGGYEVSMGHGGNNGAILTTTATGTVTATVFAKIHSDNATAMGILEKSRNGFIIVENIDDDGDCEALFNANLVLGKLKGMWVLNHGKSHNTGFIPVGAATRAAYADSTSGEIGRSFISSSTTAWSSGIVTSAHSLEAREAAAGSYCDNLPVTLAFGYGFR